MKKLFLIGILLCSAIILIGAQTGFAWDTYEGGCQTCHGSGFSGLTPPLHTLHAGQTCTICHPGVAGAKPIPTSNCAGCHPAADPGVCPLINVPAHAGTQATCLACHTPISGCQAPSTTTTTVAASTTTTIAASTTTTIAASTTTTVAASTTTTVAASTTTTIATSTTTTIAASTTTTVPASTTTTIAASTTTTVPASTTTTVPSTGCSVVSVEPAPAFLNLKAGLLPKLRRIIITGEGSNWYRASAVSIEDIPIVIPLRVQPTKIFALMVIPSKLFGRFTPGEKEVGVATGSEFCSGTVDIE